MPLLTLTFFATPTSLFYGPAVLTSRHSLVQSLLSKQAIEQWQQ